MAIETSQTSFLAKLEAELIITALYPGCSLNLQLTTIVLNLQLTTVVHMVGNPLFAVHMLKPTIHGIDSYFSHCTSKMDAIVNSLFAV